MAKNLITIDCYLEPASQARLANLCGPFDDNLKQIERRMGVEIIYKDNFFKVVGRPDVAKPVSDLLRELYIETQPVKGKVVDLEPQAVHLAIEECKALEQQSSANHGKEIYIKTRKGVIKPRNPNQQDYVANIMGHDICFGVGPAGTGKTYLAVACAVDALERQEVRRILLTRPAVEAGEKLGFLPGDLSQKVDPYLRPLYDALFEMLGFEKVERLIEKSVIEVAPLAYMRGRTLNDAFIILDESQNTTPEQMKMFLTRIGFNSKAIITGDITQVDLPRHIKSGLRQAIEVLGNVDSISFNFFQSHDIVRHQVVSEVVEAYQHFDNQQQRIQAEKQAAKLAAHTSEPEAKV
ncbi:PhoH family protein [Psychrobium sp. 1_MG-2023]|uniref:PhoH family protein n=1 Tax=Psychrobium sp. 1_MG-2023 TaxID=3062624 RepID=UPI002735281C|nr:PhoH family protein [Psychrobium sp. 1_MG-2023]MDP2560597.1 PhoH family protein [Psychrobium sp. 1_MG-2023]